MPDPIVDLFVLTLPAGMSLRAFAERGPLDHHAPMLARLGEQIGPVVLLHHGSDAERLPERFAQIGVPVAVGDGMVDRVLAAVPGAQSVVIKTLQLHDSGASLALRDALNARGATTALIARGGHLRSRFMARQHGADSPEARLAGQEEHRLCAAGDLVVGTTGIMVDDLAWRWHLPRCCTRVVPNFIDESIPIGDIDGRNAGTVLVVGPLRAYKRIDRVIDAIGALPESQRDTIRVEIVGTGPEEHPLRAQAERLGLCADFVGWLGHDALLERMRACAIYTHVSAYEGHPRALVEAMASGAAVLTADGWGVASMVDNGVSGVVVPGTIDSITYAISGMLEDTAWREMLGQTAAGASRRRFGLDKVFKLETEAICAALSAARGVMPAAA